ncbi:hypothetical protein TNCV_2075911 [Trichonephila clavipes]|nr:hypothetical protein TNCV_2075911 [Trichonephila clavipes]
MRAFCRLHSSRRRVREMVDVVGRLGNASRRQRPLAHDMSVLSQPAYFAHANVFHPDGKPVPIELSIATIPRNGSDPEILCITVNHAGQTSKPKDFRSNCQENARLRLSAGLRQQGPDGGQRSEATKVFSRALTICHGPGEPAEIQRHLRWNLSQPRARGRGHFVLHHVKILSICQIPAAV